MYEDLSLLLYASKHSQTLECINEEKLAFKQYNRYFFQIKSILYTNIYTYNPWTYENIEMINNHILSPNLDTKCYVLWQLTLI